MRIIRNNIPEIGPCVTLENDSGSKLKMYYNGNNFCLENENYKIGNIFTISKNNELYEPINNMFYRIKEYDRFRHMRSINGETKFEWFSDDISRNRLVIAKKEFGYWIVFLKNRNNYLESANNCKINFSLTNSNNQNIAKLFDGMFLESASFLLPYVVRKKYIKKDNYK